VYVCVLRKSVVTIVKGGVHFRVVPYSFRHCLFNLNWFL